MLNCECLCLATVFLDLQLLTEGLLASIQLHVVAVVNVRHDLLRHLHALRIATCPEVHIGHAPTLWLLR